MGIGKSFHVTVAMLFILMASPLTVLSDEVGPMTVDQLVDHHKQDVDVHSMMTPNFNYVGSVGWALATGTHIDWSYSIDFSLGCSDYATANFGSTEGGSGTETFSMSNSVPPIPQAEYNLCACNVHTAWWAIEGEIMKKHLKEQYWYVVTGMSEQYVITRVEWVADAYRHSKKCLNTLNTFDSSQSCYGLNNYPPGCPFTKNWHYHWKSAQETLNAGGDEFQIGAQTCISDVPRRGGL